jgi:hypothetical protein
VSSLRLLHSNPYTFHLLSQPTFVPSLDMRCGDEGRSNGDAMRRTFELRGWHSHHADACTHVDFDRIGPNTTSRDGPC